MSELEKLDVEVVLDPNKFSKEANSLESIIFDLDSQIEMLSFKT